MDLKHLELWYQKNHRKLKFRETKEPYFIWVSEVMLQQTQVETVLPFFKSFIEKYPTIYDLANESEEQLKKHVEGLGYYRRFKHMHEASKIIVSKYNGIFPNTYEAIILLPGIGKYTAGAIMSICYNKPYSAVDGNVIRVLSRFYNIDLDMRIEKNKKIIDQKNQALIEKATPFVYTQAMMELGATLCRPKQPKCDICPIQKNCISYQENNQHLIPNRSKPKDKKEFNYIVLVIKNKDQIYLRKRNESLLEGMYEYPQFESESIYNVLEMLERKGLSLEIIEEKKSYHHIFTHQVWHLNVYEARIISGMILDWILVDINQIHSKPMAIAHRKIKI
jgi:A/G-specific adenine glycosylase